MTESLAKNNDGHPIGFESCEFVSIFDHWLLPDEVDAVKPYEWKKFWALTDRLFDKFQIYGAYPNFLSMNNPQYLKKIHAKEFLHGKWHSDDSEGANPMIIKIPELNCVYEEHHDYTNLFWYNDQESLEVISKLVTSVGLFHFNQEQGFQNRNNAQSVV